MPSGEVTKLEALKAVTEHYHPTHSTLDPTRPGHWFTLASCTNPICVRMKEMVLSEIQDEESRVRTLEKWKEIEADCDLIMHGGVTKPSYMGNVNGLGTDPDTK